MPPPTMTTSVVSAMERPSYRLRAAEGLAGYEERDIFTLSGGERRRAALAAVLAQNPRIFLLDEPTNQLDPNHQIEALQQKHQLPALAVVVVKDGKICDRAATG